MWVSQNLLRLRNNSNALDPDDFMPSVIAKLGAEAAVYKAVWSEDPAL